MTVIIVVVSSSTVLIGRRYFGSVFERPPMPILFVFLILDVVFAFIALNFRKVEIEVDQKCVRLSYGILKTTIPAAEIVSCEIARTKLPLYGGVGLRLGQDDLPGFTAGNAVKIVTKAGKTFMIPTNKPAELSKVINSLSMQKLET
ncbi:MAG: hypothetical protein QXZ68_02310 [Candidatus Bathyarchaeia archaeon]